MRYIDPSGHIPSGTGDQGTEPGGGWNDDPSHSTGNGGGVELGWGAINQPDYNESPSLSVEQVQERLHDAYVKTLVNMYLNGQSNHKIDLATHIVIETQQDLQFPENINSNWKGENYQGKPAVGQYNPITDTLSLDGQYYSGKFSVDKAKDLLDTLIHEALHKRDPLSKQLLDRYRPHPEIWDETAKRVGDILKIYK